MFPDRLKLLVTLRIGGDTFVVPAGSVRALRLRASTYGFDASVAFIVSSEEVEDALFPRFGSRDRIDVCLSVLVRPLDDPDDTSERSLAVSGIVVDRCVTETVSDSLEGEPIFERRYEMEIVDPLRALWSEHRPLDLLVDSTMGEAIERHKPAGIELTYDFSRLNERQDVLFVPLRADHPPSFYDFVVQFLAETNGVLEYFPRTGTYRIGKKKSRPRRSLSLEQQSLSSLCVQPSEPHRHVTRVLNSFTDGAKIETIPNDLAVRNVRRDVLALARVPARFERQVAVEKTRMGGWGVAAGGHTLHAVYAQCPTALVTPGDGIDVGESFGETLYTSTKSYRVTSLSLAARGPIGTDTEEVAVLDDVTARFDIELDIAAELVSDATPRLPRFRTERTPLCLEGRVLSASGGDDDRTWFAAANVVNGVWQLRCAIPLFNVDVVVPFEPDHDPGHFFFPPYKGQRVLVSLERDSARLERCLDWANNARTPAAAQGNRVALGYREGNGTTLDHGYVDGKPVFTVERKLKGDHQVLVMRDQTIRMQVEELPSTEPSAPKFDVSPRVAAAKAKLVGEVQASVGKITGSFETSSSAVSASVETAAAEVTAVITVAETALRARIEAIRTELSSMFAALGDSPARLATAAAEAKAAIKAALK